MDVQLELAGRSRGSRSVVVKLDGREVGRLHSGVASALAPVLGDGPVPCVAACGLDIEALRRGGPAVSRGALAPSPPQASVAAADASVRAAPGERGGWCW